MNLLARKFPTILGLLLLVALVVGSFYYFQGNKIKTSATVVPSKVRISNIADNKFSVSWVSQDPTIGAVEYGVVGEKLTSLAADERDRETKGEYLTHQVTIEGLQPSTQYAFRILVGSKPNRFDNNGSPYTIATGPVIGSTPSSSNFYGNAQLSSKQAAIGSLVYLTLPGGATASTLVREAGNYAFTLSTIRSSDLRSFVQYDPAATIASVTIESGKQQSTASVSLANSAPVPTITLGQNADFLNQAQTPIVAELQPASSPVSSPEAQTPSIFNVEPLTGADINVVSTGVVVILNPKEEGEILSTLRPEFRGTGPAGTSLSIALTGQKAISDTVKIGTDKTWSWAPVIDLKVGAQKITVSYLNEGKTTKVERTFTISTSKVAIEPAFVASPSAGTTTTIKTSASPTPRVAMPATDSGVPVTGVIENTLLTAGIGIVIMVVGAMLFAL
jgi:hypothetical protein